MAYQRSFRIQRPLLLVMTLALLASLILNLLVFGGLARLPQIGNVFRESARREAAWAYAYMRVGEEIGKQAPPWDRVSQQLAMWAFGDRFITVRTTPLLAMAEIRRPVRGVRALIQYNRVLTPWLFLVWLLSWLLRSRKVRSLGS